MEKSLYKKILLRAYQVGEKQKNHVRCCSGDQKYFRGDAVYVSVMMSETNLNEVM